MGRRSVLLCVGGCRRPLEPMDLSGVDSVGDGVPLQLPYQGLGQWCWFALTAPKQTRGGQHDDRRADPPPAARHDCADSRDHGWRSPGTMYVYTRSWSTSLRVCTNPLRSYLPSVVLPSIDMSTGSTRSTSPMCTASNSAT